MLVYGVQKPYPHFLKLLVSVKLLGVFSFFSPLMYPNLLAAETPECDQSGFLLKKEFLKKHRDMCSSSIRASETVTPEFPVKLMNILDPLRNDNNVGRCVNLGNCAHLSINGSWSSCFVLNLLYTFNTSYECMV